MLLRRGGDGLLLRSCGEPACRQSARTSCQPVVLFTFRHIQRPEGHRWGRERGSGGSLWGYNLGYQDKLSLVVDVHSPSDIPSGQGEGGRRPASVVCVCVFTYRGEVDVLHLIDPCRGIGVNGPPGRPDSWAHVHAYTLAHVHLSACFTHLLVSDGLHRYTVTHTHVSWHAWSRNTHAIPSLHTDTPRCDPCCVRGQFATVEPQGELLVCGEFLCIVSVCSICLQNAIMMLD